LIVLDFTFIKVGKIIWWLPYLILIIFSIPLFCEITMIRKNVKTNHKKPINLNFKKAIKIRYIILLIAILLFFLSPIYLPHIIKHHIEEYAQSETAKSDLHKLTSKITGEYNDETNKTKAILRWFDRDSRNINNILQKEELLIEIYPLHIYTSKLYICIRLIGHENPLWVLKSRCGACGEYALLYREIANASNLAVRSIHNPGEDHNWDEVLINDDWVVVDPSIVNLSNNETGFNASQMLNEEWWNISHVFALYPNRTAEDVTYRYTNLSNLTIITIDENKMTVSNVSVQILSNNRVSKKGVNTRVNCTTDFRGSCEIKIGSGNYTIKGEKENNGLRLSAESTITLMENEDNSTQPILKRDRFWWLQYPLPPSLMLILLILCCIGLWSFIILYIEAITKEIEKEKVK